MPKRLLSNWLTEYMEYSAFSEAPDKFHFWTGVSCIAGALRRKVWIDQGYFQWTPNFYIVFVAPPGIVSKSTTASIGMNLLRQVPDIAFGPDTVTWQSLVEELGKATETFEIIDKSTGEVTTHAMSAVTIVSSEFGNFLNPSDREMVDVLVSLWDGQIGTWKKSTKTQGSDSIENPWINIVACTTPAWIAGNFPEYMIGGGFTSRTVFVYAERKRRLVAYPKTCIPKDFVEHGKRLVHDLEVISNELKGEYIMSDDAISWGKQWYEEHYHTKPPHLDNERFGGYLARKQTHIHKLAMILAASEGNDLVLTKNNLVQANDITTAIEFDMPKVFSNIGKTDITRISAELIGLVQANRIMSVQEVYQKFFDRVSISDFEIILQGAIKVGYVKQKQVGSTMMLESTLPPKESVDGSSSVVDQV